MRRRPGVRDVLLRSDGDSAWLKVAAYRFRDKLAFAEARARNGALASRLGVGSYPALVAACGGDVDHTVTYAGELSHSMTPDKVEEWLEKFQGGELCASTRKTPKAGTRLDASLDYGKMRREQTPRHPLYQSHPLRAVRGEERFRARHRRSDCAARGALRREKATRGRSAVARDATSSLYRASLAALLARKTPAPTSLRRPSRRRASSIRRGARGVLSTVRVT